MTREIHQVPPAPRAVRWRAVLWHWWPMAFLGFVLAIYGGLFTYMLFLADGGKRSDDALLDREHAVARGKITALHRPGQDSDADAAANMPVTSPLRVDYDFDDRFGPRSGSCLIDLRQFNQPEPKVGQTIPVEFHPSQSHINRIAGARIMTAPSLQPLFFWTIVVPGMVSLGLWLFGVLRLRHIMRTGDVAVANIILVRKINLVMPTMLHVEYDYRDRHAKRHNTWHWVRARSELGERLLQKPKSLAVLIPRGAGRKSRLAIANDFRQAPDCELPT